MIPQKYDLFLKHGAFPKNVELNWAVINQKKELVRLSEAFYQFVGKPISAILNRALTSCFSSIDINELLLPQHGYHITHWISDKGVAVQGRFSLMPNEDNLWCLQITTFALDERWLMELHPEYSNAVQKSDDWLQQIEAVVASKPEDVFRVAINQAVALTSSTVGYLHLYDTQKAQITLTAWSDAVVEKCVIPEEKHYAEGDAGIWMDCVRTGHAVIHNDYLNEPKRKGLPYGHFKITSHMSVPIYYRNRIVGVIGVGNRDKPYTEVDAKSLTVFATILWHCVELPKSMRAISKQSVVIREQKNKLTQTLVKLVGAISEAVELKDAYTAGHQKSVAQLAYLIGERLGLDANRLEGLKLGAMIHDIGKLGVPTQILSKPAKLTTEEYALIKMHSQQGADIIAEVEFPWPIKEMILQHHERLDGSGYPLGLKGNDIILEAKIIAVADVADSVLSHRPYRPSLGLHKLASILEQGKGVQFNAKVVEACLDILADHDLENVQYISHLPLAPVVMLTLDNTLNEIQTLFHQHNSKVGLVTDGTNHKILGVVDQSMLIFWRSPLLDTAAERLVDRNIENKRAHQVMKHKVPFIAANTILKDAKHSLEQLNEDYLIVMNEDKPLGCVTWKILATVESIEIDSHGYL
ncbi:GAF domain-containing protein [Shewanella sp. SP1S1-7]|uniref:HD domain-containing phosphohydrolase n=1 Tax=Shewanella sp. SP1S1-7 TaxID=3063536 RepID=UPI001C734CEA|nr:HD domain-containing phosphohydrolase [Shewanella sp. SP1S1-7]MDT3336028.1 GAF domain-containing protein [Shewanella sp. SP1S1-7]QYX66117.1 GAF domain-containing protein [Shewanella putrefaciens]